MTDIHHTDAVIFERSKYIEFLSQAHEAYSRLADQRDIEIKAWRDDHVARAADVKTISDERFNTKYGRGYEIVRRIEDTRSLTKKLFNIGSGEYRTYPYTQEAYADLVAKITREEYLRQKLEACDNDQLTYIRRYTHDSRYRTFNEWRSELNYIASTLEDFETMSIGATYVISRKTYDNYVDALATDTITPMYTGFSVRRY